MKLMKTTEAVGQVLCHDMTQIIPDVTKDAVFRKGHIVREEDIPVLLSIGKDHIYVWEKDDTKYHEDEAADILRGICQNEYMRATDPKEGKIELIAESDGLFQVDEERLLKVNSLPEMMIATRRTNFPVKKGDKLAGTRVIPLVIEKEKMEEAKKRILEEMQVPLNRIHHLFVTHEHTDHILGVIWMIRMIGTAIKKGNYEGIFHIYCHDGLIDTIQTFCRLTLQKKFCDLIGDPIQLIPVSDRETRQILDMKVTFFDIHSTKARQFGFRAVLPDGKIVCCPGDEPLNPLCEEFASGADWLFHEAFCLYRDREIFSPYEKHHSTVKDACELAERLGARHLILWHTEDRTYPERAALYRAEGEAYYHGDLLVPEDGSVIEL